MKKYLIAIALLFMPMTVLASAGYEATNFPTTEWNGEYCPTEDTLNGYPIYENADAISLYKNLTGPNTYWIIGVNPQDGYNPSDWYYYASPINGALPTDYTYWRSLDDSNHNGDIADFECGGGEEPPPEEATSTALYTGPNYKEWLWVNGIIIFLLAFPIWPVVFKPISTLFKKSND